MVNRLVGILCAGLMIGVNGALILRDFVPRWLAGPPPENDARLLQPGEVRRTQYAIYAEDGHLMGRSWTISQVNLAPALTIDSYTLLESAMLPNGMTTPRIRVHTFLSFFAENPVPEKLRIELEGLPLAVRLEGEPLPPDFACIWVVGEQRGEFALPAESMQAIGDVLKPFDRLPGLWEGRTWRLNLFDPLSRILPDFLHGDIETDSVLVRVTRMEIIRHGGQDVPAYRVEAPGAVAWAASDGRVLRQEVQVPLLGRLTLLDEEWNSELFRISRDQTFGGPADPAVAGEAAAAPPQESQTP